MRPRLAPERPVDPKGGHSPYRGWFCFPPLGLDRGNLLAASVVIPAPDSNLLRFSVSDAHSRNAILLANTYAREFTRYKAERGALRSTAHFVH